MTIPGGIEVFLVPALFLLALLGLGGKYVLKWIRQGYGQGVDENQPDTPPE